jgi:ATP-dependent DNA helicase RecG
MKLIDRIEKNFRINDIQKKALGKLGLFSVGDLLFYFPSRYTDMSEIRYINSLQDGENVTILGKISKLEIKKGWKSKIPMGSAILSDTTGSIKIVWFHQPYLAKMLKEDSTGRVTGKVNNDKTYGMTFTNAEMKKEDILPIDLNDSLFTKGEKNQQFGYPVYPESKGITSKWFYHAVNKILKDECVKNITEYIPEEIIKKYSLPALRTALVWIHTPQKKEHAEMARKRFAFEEVFFIQLSRQKERKEYESLFSYKLKIPEKDIKDFISRFPFTPTKAQNDTIRTILDDLIKEKAMSRLIEGDVGSGKTFVAATVAYAVIKNRPLKHINKCSSDHFSKKNDLAVGQNFGNIQVAYMAPTEVLTTQLFENFISYFRHTGIQIGLITGSGCRKFPTKVASSQTEWTTISRSQLLKWVKNGEIPILIGTHALISKSVDFEDLGLVIIDEQHRFGTNQRMKLAKKEGHAPHYLSMTATPIPRTLALTIYGDLDLSIIDEMPAGRKKVITEIVTEKAKSSKAGSPDISKEMFRERAYEKIKEELKEGRQLYVICPKIEEGETPTVLSDTSPFLRGRAEYNTGLDLRAVTSEAKRLKKEIFPEYRIEIMHSKMTKQKKEKIMQDFYAHKIDILVSTSVIEVGVNVPNATVIIIEGAERFGLAQLHQLRGRVIRSTYQSYCYLFADAKTEKTTDRLKALVKAENGFELAELDLSLRGAGLLGGEKQWGITDIGMEALRNIKMVEAARNEAINLVDKDPNIKKYPLLADILEKRNLKQLHFE